MRERWLEVDDYISDRLVGSDQTLDEVLAANAAAGLPAIDVAPNQGKLLFLLARMTGARQVLEIGTLGAYSSIWLGRAVSPGGRVITLEASPVHARVAGRNIERAGLSGVIEIRIGRGLDTLPTLSGEAPFDLVFIDADKESSADYLGWALKWSRPGTVIVMDNVVRGGRITDARTTESSALGIRRAFDLIAGEPRLTATALQTVGRKGWDGFAVAIVDLELA